MFLLVSSRHVGAHLGGHQHGGSIQISLNLGKTFLLISSVRKIAVTWILARFFAYLPSFYFQILDLIDRTVFNFYFDLFWMAWHWKPAIHTCMVLFLIIQIKMGSSWADGNPDEGYLSETVEILLVNAGLSLGWGLPVNNWKKISLK